MRILQIRVLVLAITIIWINHLNSESVTEIYQHQISFNHDPKRDNDGQVADATRKHHLVYSGKTDENIPKQKNGAPDTSEQRTSYVGNNPLAGRKRFFPPGATKPWGFWKNENMRASRPYSWTTHDDKEKLEKLRKIKSAKPRRHTTKTKKRTTTRTTQNKKDSKGDTKMYINGSIHIHPEREEDESVEELSGHKRPLSSYSDKELLWALYKKLRYTIDWFHTTTPDYYDDYWHYDPF